MIRMFKENLLIKTISLILLALLASGCTTVSQQKADWRQNWPERSYYEAQYAADVANQAAQSRDDYIKWVKRYYKGFAFYPEGWDWLTEAVLKEIEDYPQRLRLKDKMYSIGERISAEWAKSSDHRQINSKNLLVWADAVKRSVIAGEEELLADKISVDVDALLAGTLKTSDVRLTRYFASANRGADSEDSGDEDFAMGDEF